MTELNQVYKCNVCGNIIEVLHTGVGQLVCCNEPMQLMQEKREDKGNEKHVPVIDKTEKGIKIKVGSVQHPMQEKHFIEWIEVISKKKTYKKFLTFENIPEAEFEIPKQKSLIVRIYCNIHGLWENKV